MKAIRLYAQGGPAQFVYEDAPQPQPEHGEALVRVYAAGVTPAEPSWPGIWKTSAGGRRSQVIPGHDVAGIVEEVGPGVMGVSIGEEVYGLTDFARDGAEAEYTLALPSELAPRPRSLDLIQAAAVPLAALTVWQAFFDHANLSAGQSILIHGAAGGVGAFAVQIAHWAGARVIANAAADQHDLLRSLGADDLIDYTTARFEDTIRDVDVVLDTVGGDTLERSWGVLKKGGALVSVVEPPSQKRAAAQGVRAVFFIVRPNRAQLIRLSELIDAGRVRPVIAGVLPLAQARQAYEGQHRGGKIVLQVVDEDKIIRDVAEHEREALDDYGELGMTGDMGEQEAYREEFASGEVSRELREMRHGEFGPKAYEWLEKEHEQREDRSEP
jgi:NADPH:quinone reductase-like Zn-dependent oxidoreductase